MTFVWENLLPVFMGLLMVLLVICWPLAAPFLIALIKERKAREGAWKPVRKSLIFWVFIIGSIIWVILFLITLLVLIALAQGLW